MKLLLHLLRRPSPATVLAAIALFVALDGPATAKRWIDGSEIRPNSITGTQVRNGSVGIADLSNATVRALRKSVGASVTARHLAAGAVGSTQLADGAVGATKLADGAVTAAKLAPGAVGAGQLAAGAVGAAQVASGAIGEAAIADGSLTTRDVGSFTGAVAVTFDPFDPGTCQVAEFTPQPAGGGSPMPADDIVAVSPAAGWPDPLVVTGKPAAYGKIRIVACYVAPGGATTLSGVSTTFRYVTFDAP